MDLQNKVHQMKRSDDNVIYLKIVMASCKEACHRVNGIAIMGQNLES